MTTEAWLTVFAAFVSGGGLTALTGYLQSRYRDRQASKLAERQQPIDQYVRIVEQLEDRLNRSDKEHRDEIASIVRKLETCQEHHVSCERDMAFVKGQMHELSKMVRQSGPMVTVQGAGELRSIEASGPSEIATFDAGDSTRMERAPE